MNRNNRQKREILLKKVIFEPLTISVTFKSQVAKVSHSLAKRTTMKCLRKIFSNNWPNVCVDLRKRLKQTEQNFSLVIEIKDSNSNDLKNSVYSLIINTNYYLFLFKNNFNFNTQLNSKFYLSSDEINMINSPFNF